MAGARAAVDGVEAGVTTDGESVVVKWVKHGLWLAAWGGWLALGIGLHRQLPRVVGPKVCEIQLASSERLVGFIKGRHELLVQPEQFVRPIALKVYNAETGGVTRELSLGDRLPQLPLATGHTHGVVVARGQGRQMAGLEIQDLVSGQWMRVTDKMALNVVVHPERPCIAFRETTGPIDKRRPLAVVDWTTGEEVFSLAPSPDLVAVGFAFFLGDGQRLAIPVNRKPGGSRADQAGTAVEIWRIGAPSRLERTVNISDLPARPRVGGAGRLARLRQRKGAVRELAVYDIDDGRELFATEWEWDSSIVIGSEVYFLSRSGRTLLGGLPVEVWDVDSGARRWNPPAGRTLQRGYEELDAFSVLETWDESWTKGKLKHWNTVALHDLDTGAFRFRCWEGDAALLQYRSNDDALGVVVGPKNLLAVWELPFRVNWLLLSLCQAILALPLVLFWVAIRLRRRGRLKAL